MANLSKTTRDREEIRNWAEARGGKPAHVKETGSGEDIGILRIEFPGYSGEGSLEQITWEEFFDKFGERNLALIYQEETAEGAKSNFNKLVSAETAAESESRPSKKSAGKKSTSKGRSSAAKKTGGLKKSALKRASTSSSNRPAAARKKAKSVSKRSATKKAAKKAPARSAGRKKSPAKKTSTKKTSAKKSVAKKRR